MPRLERRLFFLLIVTLVWSIAMGFQMGAAVSKDFQRPASCSHFAGQPIADLELASSADCFSRVVAQGLPDELPHNAAVFRTNTYLDFAFIGLYWTVFVLFAIVDCGPWSKWIIGLISVTALFDVLENARILASLGDLLTSGSVQGMLPRWFSLVKWATFGVSLICLGILRWYNAKRWPHVLSAALVGCGAFTLTGLVIPTAMTYVVYGFALVFVLAIARFWPYSLESTLVGIEYAYLMRFQLLAALILAVGLPIGYRLIPSLFVGLFDGRGFLSFAFIVWAAFQLAWTILVTCRLVLVYGPDRFARARAPEDKPVEPVGIRTVVAFGLLALPLVIVLYTGTSKPHLGAVRVLAALAGLALAILVLLLTAALHFAIEDPGGKSAGLVFPAFGFLDNKTPTIQSAPWAWAGRRLAALGPDLTAGILDGTRLRSGHEMATIALGVFLVIYIAVGAFFSPAYSTPERQPAALFFLLLILTVFTWLLSGAAFFLDRTRLPVFTTLLAVSLLTGFVRTDHEFVVTEKTVSNPSSLRPADVIHSWEKSDRWKDDKTMTITIVATAGGGIRAAAWTAEVMTRLQRDCKPLSSSLLLVSSVSGGSVGSMFVVGPYSGTGDYPSTEAELAAIRYNASRSSLSAVGWGLAYPDLARTAPLAGILVPQTLDRGWSLENAWETAWKSAKLPAPTMQKWREDVSNGSRPAVIFNATVSESGERFLIASTETSSEGTKQFFDLFPQADLDVATAARLSATFPYVSPLTRPSIGPISTAYHIGDGGYYDNSGLLSAVEWLRDAGDALRNYQVLLILIDARPGTPKGGSSWSWQKQSVGPLETLLHVRSSSQQLRDTIELHMAMDYLDAHYNKKGMVIPAQFLFSSPTPSPLSWHLTGPQNEEIGESWKQEENQKSRDLVYGSLGCPVETQSRK